MPIDRALPRFVVLTVCTGNICRSPYAERLLRLALARTPSPKGPASWVWSQGIAVTSAGTRAMAGFPVAPLMAAQGERFGIDTSGHVARGIDYEIVAAARLILALSRDHRRDVARLVPLRSRVTFTLSEFARLADDAYHTGLLALSTADSPADAFGQFVDCVASRRGFAVPPTDPAEDDILDPYGGNEVDYTTSADQIAAAVATIETCLHHFVSAKIST